MTSKLQQAGLLQFRYLLFPISLYPPHHFEEKVLFRPKLFLHVYEFRSSSYFIHLLIALQPAIVVIFTTSVGGNMEVIKHLQNGFIFSPGNILELKSLLAGILNNEVIINQEINMLMRLKML